MNSVSLLIGGNQGDRRALIDAATALIAERIGPVVAASRVYETLPWGNFGEDRVQPFLNRALVVDTKLDAQAVLDEALAIEAELGRCRSPETERRLYHSRPMDIDIIFFNDEVIESPTLTVPHPRMHLRRFVLEPLNEVVPHYRHPLTGLTVSEMLDRLKQDEEK